MPLLGTNGAINGLPPGGLMGALALQPSRGPQVRGLINTASSYDYPLTRTFAPSLMSALISPSDPAQTRPAAVPDYSARALQMAGSPHAGAFPQVAPPSGVGVPGPAAGNSGYPGTGGPSTASQVLQGLLGALINNPSLLKSATGLIGNLFGGNASDALSEITPSVAPVLSEVTPSVSPILSEVTPSVAPLLSEVTPSVAPVLSEVTPSVAPLLSEVTPSVAPIATAAPAAAPAAAPTASGGSLLGTVGGALGGAALAGGLLYGLGSLFDALDPIHQMTPQEMAALLPQQSPAEIAARQTEPLMTSAQYNPYAGLDPSQLMAAGLLSPGAFAPLGAI